MVCLYPNQHCCPLCASCVCSDLEWKPASLLYLEEVQRELLHPRLQGEVVVAAVGLLQTRMKVAAVVVAGAVQLGYLESAAAEGEGALGVLLLVLEREGEVASQPLLLREGEVVRAVLLRLMLVLVLRVLRML